MPIKRLCGWGKVVEPLRIFGLSVTAMPVVINGYKKGAEPEGFLARAGA
jgi:hypothetical protein